MVYVGTIHPHHLSAGKLFMKSRKNVLIEKPLAMNSREVQELITAAQKDNVFLMEVTFFFPSTKITCTIPQISVSNHSAFTFRQFGRASFRHRSK